MDVKLHLSQMTCTVYAYLKRGCYERHFDLRERKLTQMHNEELHDFYSLYIRLNKSKWMNKVGYMAQRREKRNTYGVMVVIP